ncbi:MAG: hypothetical protein A2261_03780 [Candidatus Magasanikbacteria bacterium RIFOXYA2_FULL_44_8]|uniref:Glycosyl transferase n=1 Tax=Candidatus Magasanikbacteria bacterium RIFOXYA2_FULL_44_8 TaxID=1798696 RepID=A0A1F6NIV8_9BACT|nr:MAG: hypothetical protein A2261_03780 [Candidatus Magasanikbacteria bacterium RIFOXYA2_FULL_44_8]
MQDFIEILGIRISRNGRAGALALARGFLYSSGQYKIFTPNPEFLVRAQKDAYFKTILNSANLNVCDGFGLYLASLGKLKRIPGVDFMLDICRAAADNNVGIFLLGGVGGVVKNTATELSKQIPSLKICGYDSGPTIQESAANPNALVLNESENQNLITKINSSGAKILFVAFGMGKQEKWIYENLAKMPNVKIAMGVGGSFDYLSGTVQRAPCFMRKIGLEWLYRVIVQPKRLDRIINAILVFPYLVIKNKLK